MTSQKRATVYLRERAGSVQAQREACAQWAAARGLRIVVGYEGETASEVNPKLLEDLKAGKFDVLVADFGPETFTRSAGRYQELTEAAAEAGVEVRTVGAPTLLTKIAQRIIEGRDRNTGLQQPEATDSEDVYRSALWDVLACALGAEEAVGRIGAETLEKSREAQVEQFIQSVRDTQGM
ncbi:recombinase family protein [Saccharothrix sp. ST-888]|uniref:recombinase family protein n=1 Tax=Saccharothrix sp. ST-888 TaxID=1427391 RepID=UPI0005EC322E|nr:recombinase family protein [Saccharothrix sp. ST-888]KJK56245.1 hypothetical protein UK12_23980 [Saccharothrix sp. ST-888]